MYGALVSLLSFSVAGIVVYAVLGLRGQVVDHTLMAFVSVGILVLYVAGCIKIAGEAPSNRSIVREALLMFAPSSTFGVSIVVWVSLVGRLPLEPLVRFLPFFTSGKKDSKRYAALDDEDEMDSLDAPGFEQ